MLLLLHHLIIMRLKNNIAIPLNMEALNLKQRPLLLLAVHVQDLQIIKRALKHILIIITDSYRFVQNPRAQNRL
mgnify:CR=1 FL=1